MKNLTFKELEGTPNAEILRGVLDLYKIVFGVEKIEKVIERLTNKTDLHLALAFSEAEIIGFKIGYRQDDTTFYSWLGAVHPTFRGQGIAITLMTRQHDFCEKMGYAKIQTKTLNRWRSMLILNLKNGFDIVETYRDEQEVVTIILEKQLDESEKFKQISPHQ